eukprot:scaffold75773_cov57-Attheya_sp.AAC.7
MDGKERMENEKQSNVASDVMDLEQELAQALLCGTDRESSKLSSPDEYSNWPILSLVFHQVELVVTMVITPIMESSDKEGGDQTEFLANVGEKLRCVLTLVKEANDIQSRFRFAYHAKRLWLEIDHSLLQLYDSLQIVPHPKAQEEEEKAVVAVTFSDAWDEGYLELQAVAKHELDVNRDFLGHGIVAAVSNMVFADINDVDSDIPRQLELLHLARKDLVQEQDHLLLQRKELHDKGNKTHTKIQTEIDFCHQTVAALEIAERDLKNKQNDTHLLSLPATFLCPITMNIMTEPVTVDADCQCAISSEAFRVFVTSESKFCPVCAMRLHSPMGTPNPTLAKNISNALNERRNDKNDMSLSKTSTVIDSRHGDDASFILTTPLEPSLAASKATSIRKVSNMRILVQVGGVSISGHYTGEIQHPMKLPHGCGFILFFDPNKPMGSPIGKYSGEWKLGKRHGLGVFLLAGVTEYEGDWRDDVFHGRGNVIWSHEHKYNGEFKNGQKHGWGVAILPNGEKYDGQWSHGQAHGRGAVRYANIDRYDGEWENGKKSGRGVYSLANGDRYSGQFVHGMIHGQGILTHGNGSEYTGQFQNQQKHGQGVYAFANGDVYDGEWRNDKRNGMGTFTYGNGNMYVGNFMDNGRSGRGILTYANGDTYDGEWWHDEKRGRGVFQYANGNSYVGEWEASMKHGCGVFTWVGNEPKKVRTYSSSQHDDESQSSGTSRESGDSKIFDGDWKKDQPHGKGILKFADGSTYDGGWKNGERHGRGIYLFSDGRKVKQFWHHGTRRNNFGV